LFLQGELTYTNYGFKISAAGVDTGEIDHPSWLYSTGIRWQP
jgi:hypothetical protein